MVHIEYGDEMMTEERCDIMMMVVVPTQLLTSINE